MALFRCASGSSGGGATITVTYSSDFYGETVTCSHGTKTYSKVATSSGTLEFSVDEEGTWTISSMGFSDTADVVLNYPAELVSIPDGETVLPTDDIETWLKCAGITDKSYTTISQVLADSETYNALLGDSNACAYMKRSTTWSTDICASQYAMNLLGQYDTACDALLSDATWASAIANSDYFEYVLDVKIPTMTGYTTPSGEVFPNNGTGTYAWWHAFDGNTSTRNEVSYESYDNRLGYKFLLSVMCVCAKIGGYPWQSATYKLETFKIVASNDNSTWVELTDTISNTATASGDIQLVPFTKNVDNYEYYAINVLTSGSSSDKRVQVESVQFYGRHSSQNLIPLVPTMTSNTTPSGECIGTSAESSYALYYAFDSSSSTAWYARGNETYIGYISTSATPIGCVTTHLEAFSGSDNSQWDVTVEASYDNGSTWSAISETVTTVVLKGAVTQDLSIPCATTSDTSYKRLKFVKHLTSTSYDYSPVVTNVQFYGRKSSSEKVHGANGESAYILDGGSPVTITDPSTLDAGTYTVYSTVAKNPSDLTADYSKTVRICPNTKEIVVRPDNALYWWGYENSNLEDVTSANGWSQGSVTLDSPTHNQTTISIVASGGAHISGIGTKKMLSSISAIKCIVKATTLASNTAGKFNPQSSKTSFTYASGTGMDSTSNTLYTIDATSLGNKYYTITTYTGRAIDVSAVFYE